MRHRILQLLITLWNRQYSIRYLFYIKAHLGCCVCCSCIHVFMYVYYALVQTYMWSFIIQDGRQNVSTHALQWRHDERNGISNHQRLDCLFKRLLKRRSKKTPKLRVTGLCAGNSPVTAQRASNPENVSFRWRHHFIKSPLLSPTANDTTTRRILCPKQDSRTWLCDYAQQILWDLTIYPWHIYLRICVNLRSESRCLGYVRWITSYRYCGCNYVSTC